MRHIHLLRTDSTNTYLRSLLSGGESVESYTIVTAHEQTAGRGQRGNHWESNPGENITLSILIRPEMGRATTYDLSIVAALAASAIIADAVEHKAEVKIKWPNDILIEERKIAGILIENEFAGSEIDSCIIGLGLNVAQERYEIYHPEATSLALERKRVLLPALPMSLPAWQDHLLRHYVGEVERRLVQMQDDLTGLRAEYHDHLFRLGRCGCHYHTADGRPFAGTLLGVEPSGMLRVRDDESLEVRLFAFKEVQFSFDTPDE